MHHMRFSAISGTPGPRFQAKKWVRIAERPIWDLLAVLGGTARIEPVAIVPSMTDELAVTIVFEPGEDGWVIATIPEVNGVFSQGRTREEARANVIDALRLMLSPEPTSDDDRREREQLHLTIAA